MDDREERIRVKAYELWEQAGRPEGQGAEHWAEAERRIDAEQGHTESSATNPDRLQEAPTSEKKVVVRRKRKESVKPIKSAR